jgi:hypothetical protein
MLYAEFRHITLCNGIEHAAAHGKAFINPVGVSGSLDIFDVPS